MYFDLIYLLSAIIHEKAPERCDYSCFATFCPIRSGKTLLCELFEIFRQLHLRMNGQSVPVEEFKITSIYYAEMLNYGSSQSIQVVD
jgi:hypothetical protein